MGKEPWQYDLETDKSMTRFMRLRAQLVPYLATADVLTHQQGMPLIEPVYYRYPEVKEAYQFKMSTSSGQNAGRTDHNA